MTDTQTKRMTAADLLQMPDDGGCYELVQGELRTMSPTKQKHGRVAGKLAWRLGQYVETNRLGEVYIAEAGFVLTRDPDTVRVPDVAFVRRERFEAIGDIEGFWPEAPDLAVEVVSPSDRPGDVSDKVAAWLAAGTRLVIVIEPRKRRVTVYHSPPMIEVLREEDQLTGGDVVPGWTMPISALFV